MIIDDVEFVLPASGWTSDEMAARGATRYRNPAYDAWKAVHGPKLKALLDARQYDEWNALYGQAPPGTLRDDDIDVYVLMDGTQIWCVPRKSEIDAGQRPFRVDYEGDPYEALARLEAGKA